MAPKTGCLWDAELWFVEPLLDEDELGALEAVLGAELWTEDVSGDEAAELSGTVESAADATVVADEVADAAVDAAEAC